MVFQDTKTFVYDFFKLAWARKERKMDRGGSSKIMGMGRRSVRGRGRKENGERGGRKGAREGRREM